MEILLCYNKSKQENRNKSATLIYFLILKKMQDVKIKNSGKDAMENISPWCFRIITAMKPQAFQSAVLLFI